jgi:hypothetical protein
VVNTVVAGGKFGHYYRYATKWHSNSRLDREPVTIVLSPHIDDVFLSLGTLIEAGKLGRSIIGVNVFTATDSTSTVSTRSDFSTVARVSTRRMAEELRLADHFSRKNLSYMPVFLGLKDAAIGAYYENIAGRSIRAMPSLIKGYAKKVSAAYVSKRMAETNIAAILDNLLLQFGKNVRAVVAPVGIGDHIDHMMLRAYAERLSSRMMVGLYADVPYIYHYVPLTLDGIRTMLPKGFHSYDQGLFDSASKTRLFNSIYKSQRDAAMLGALKAISRSVGETVFWSR